MTVYGYPSDTVRHVRHSLYVAVALLSDRRVVKLLLTFVIRTHVRVSKQAL
jgi:hypothetical protein